MDRNPRIRRGLSWVRVSLALQGRVSRKFLTLNKHLLSTIAWDQGFHQSQRAQC